MKGYLRVRSVAGIEHEITQGMRRSYDRAEFLLDISASPEGRGWIRLTDAIKQGNVLKVSAVRHNSRFDAQFDMAAVTPGGNNGRCEIRGGEVLPKIRASG